MTSRIISFAFLAAVFPVVGAAQSYTPWVFERLQSRDGGHICTIFTARNGEDRVQNVAIKIFPEKSSMHLTAYLDTWNFQTGTQVPTTIDFMDNKPINVSGFGDGKVVDLDLKGQASFDTLGGLTHAQFIQLGFPSSGGPTWTVPMPKNRQVVKSLLDCAAKK
jgi:hypothetical protein